MSRKSNWIAALKSGKYKKCSEVLRTDTHFCAIGVLVDIEAPQSWYNSETHGMWINQEYEGSDMLHSDTAFYVGSMNDTGYSLTSIADWLIDNVDDDLNYIGN